MTDGENKVKFKRTQQPDEEHYKKESFSWLPLDISRANPWQLSTPESNSIKAEELLRVDNSIKAEEGEKSFFVYRYGKKPEIKLVLKSGLGGLTRYDELVWETLLQIVNRSDKQTKISIIEIASEMGIKNPWEKSTKDTILQSLIRLQDAEVNLIIKENGKLLRKGRFLFFEGIIDTGEKTNEPPYINIRIADYLTEIKRLGLPLYWRSYNISCHLRGNLARALYSFLLTHKSIRSGDNRGYSISLGKLCGYLNYDTKGRAWASIWQSLRGPLSQLQSLGAIKDFELNKKTCSRDSKKEGGVLTIYGHRQVLPSKQNKEVKMLPGGNYQDIIDDIIKELGRVIELPVISDKEYKQVERNLAKLEIFCEDYKHFNIRSLVHYYLFFFTCGEGKLQYFNPTIFNPDNQIFQAFFSWVVSSGNLSPAKSNPNTAKQEKEKPLNLDEITGEEKKREQEEKEKQAQEDELRKERGASPYNEQIKYVLNRQCPFGKTFGQDFDSTRQGKQEGCWECKRKYDSVHERCDIENSRGDFDQFGLDDEDGEDDN